MWGVACSDKIHTDDHMIAGLKASWPFLAHSFGYYIRLFAHVHLVSICMRQLLPAWL